MKKIIFKFLLAFVALTITCSYANAKVVGTTVYLGKTYYVDVRNNGGTADVWFIQVQDASTDGDFKASVVTVSNPTTDFLQNICRLKSVIDDEKAIVGCLATVGTGACAIGTVATDGATIYVCEAVWAYTKSNGLADCLDGIAGKIAEYLGKEKEWAAAGVMAKITQDEISEGVEKSIDLMCQDIKDGN